MPKLQVTNPEIVSIRDFQPTAHENVFVSPDGDVVIIEDGTALLIQRDENPLTIKT